MPYYVYKVTPVGDTLVKDLEKIAEFDQFKEAKLFAREQRTKQETGDTATIKVIFAENVLTAEEQLMEKREAPILREWEK